MGMCSRQIRPNSGEADCQRAGLGDTYRYGASLSVIHHHDPDHSLNRISHENASRCASVGLGQACAALLATTLSASTLADAFLT